MAIILPSPGQEELGRRRFQDNKEFRKKLLNSSREELSVLLGLLPSNYPEEPSTNMGLLYRSLSDESGRLRLDLSSLSNDLVYELTRIEYLYQILGSKLFLFDKSVPAGYSDVKFRDYLLSIKDAYLRGSTKDNLEQAVKEITGNAIKITELYKKARDPASSYGVNDTHKIIFDVFLDDIINQGVNIAGFNEDITFFINLLKPAHVLYDTRFIFKETIIVNKTFDLLYGDTGGGCIPKLITTPFEEPCFLALKIQILTNPTSSNGQIGTIHHDDKVLYLADGSKVIFEPGSKGTKVFTPDGLRGNFDSLEIGQYIKLTSFPLEGYPEFYYTPQQVIDNPNIVFYKSFYKRPLFQEFVKKKMDSNGRFPQQIKTTPTTICDRWVQDVLDPVYEDLRKFCGDSTSHPCMLSEVLSEGNGFPRFHFPLDSSSAPNYTQGDDFSFLLPNTPLTGVAAGGGGGGAPVPPVVSTVWEPGTNLDYGPEPGICPYDGYPLRYYYTRNPTSFGSGGYGGLSTASYNGVFYAAIGVHRSGGYHDYAVECSENLIFVLKLENGVWTGLGCDWDTKVPAFTPQNQSDMRTNEHLIAVHPCTGELYALVVETTPVSEGADVYLHIYKFFEGSWVELDSTLLGDAGFAFIDSITLRFFANENQSADLYVGVQSDNRADVFKLDASQNLVLIASKPYSNLSFTVTPDGTLYYITRTYGGVELFVWDGVNFIGVGGVFSNGYFRDYTPWVKDFQNIIVISENEIYVHLVGSSSIEVLVYKWDGVTWSSIASFAGLFAATATKVGNTLYIPVSSESSTFEWGTLVLDPAGETTQGSLLSLVPSGLINPFPIQPFLWDRPPTGTVDVVTGTLYLFNNNRFGASVSPPVAELKPYTLYTHDTVFKDIIPRPCVPAEICTGLPADLADITVSFDGTNIPGAVIGLDSSSGLIQLDPTRDFWEDSSVGRLPLPGDSFQFDYISLQLDSTCMDFSSQQGYGFSTYQLPCVPVVVEGSCELAGPDDLSIFIDGTQVTGSVIDFDPILGHVRLNPDVSYWDSTSEIGRLPSLGDDVKFSLFKGENCLYPLLLDDLGRTLDSNEFVLDGPDVGDMETGYISPKTPLQIGYKYRAYLLHHTSVLNSPDTLLLNNYQKPATRASLQNQQDEVNHLNLFFSPEHLYDPNPIEKLSDLYFDRDIEPVIKLGPGTPPFQKTFSNHPGLVYHRKLLSVREHRSPLMYSDLLLREFPEGEEVPLGSICDVLNPHFKIRIGEELSPLMECPPWIYFDCAETIEEEVSIPGVMQGIANLRIPGYKLRDNLNLRENDETGLAAITHTELAEEAQIEFQLPPHLRIIHNDQYINFPSLPVMKDTSTLADPADIVVRINGIIIPNAINTLNPTTGLLVLNSPTPTKAVTEYRSITQEDLDNKAIVLSDTPKDCDSVALSVVHGTPQEADIDFFVVNKLLLWGGSSLDLLEVGDILRIQYAAKSLVRFNYQIASTSTVEVLNINSPDTRILDNGFVLADSLCQEPTINISLKLNEYVNFLDDYGKGVKITFFNKDTFQIEEHVFSGPVFELFEKVKDEIGTPDSFPNALVKVRNPNLLGDPATFTESYDFINDPLVRFRKKTFKELLPNRSFRDLELTEMLGL